jgi:hypothetical protein
VLLGLGRDTWVLDNENSDLQVEVRGGPGDDEIVLFRMGNNTVIQGDLGDDDTLRVIVNGDPKVDQFARLVVGRGIERLSIDNSDNPDAVDWYVSNGSLYFANGRGTALVSTDNGFTTANFTGGAPLVIGDRILLSTVNVAITNNANTADLLDVTRGGALPGYPTTGSPPATITFDQGQFYYISSISGGRFELAHTLEEALAGNSIDVVDVGAGAVNFLRASLLTGLEGALRSEIIAGREDTDGDGRPNEDGLSISTINVISQLASKIDVYQNTLLLVEGARVLDHQDSLFQGSFPVVRVDGLFGTESVVATTGTVAFPVRDALGVTRQIVGQAAVFSAGTGEDKIGMFVRTQDPTDETRSFLRYVGYIPTMVGGVQVVPDRPHTITLSPDERFLYAIGDTSVSQFAIGVTFSGLPTLTHVATYSGALNDIFGATGATSPLLAGGDDLHRSVNFDKELHRPTAVHISPDGTLFYLTDAGTGTGTDRGDGIFVFERDPATGLLTQILQKVTRMSDFGNAIDVGFDFDNTGTVPTATNAKESDATIIVDQPVTNSAQAGLSISDFGVFRFNAVAGSEGRTITPLVFRLTNEIDNAAKGTAQFELVATGTTRIIEHSGLNEFEFDFPEGTNLQSLGESLYFGWTSDGGNVVAGVTGTSSNSYKVSGAPEFLDGHRFAIEATFETQIIAGLNDPTAIVVTPNGQRIFIGDSAGAVATFERDPDLGYKVVASEQVRSTGVTLNRAGLPQHDTLNLRRTDDGRILADFDDQGFVRVGETRIPVSQFNALMTSFASLATYAGVSVNLDTPVSIAANSTHLFVGFPTSDNDFRPRNDSGGAVLVFSLGNLTTPVQVLSGYGFGNTLAADGNRLAIGTQSQVRTYMLTGTGTSSYTAGTVINTGTVPLISMDAGRMVVAGSGSTVVYRQGTGNTWVSEGTLSGSSTGVSISGDTIVVANSGSTRMFRQINGTWQAISGQTIGVQGLRAGSVTYTDTDYRDTRVTIVSFTSSEDTPDGGGLGIYPDGEYQLEINGVDATGEHSMRSGTWNVNLVKEFRRDFPGQWAFALSAYERDGGLNGGDDFFGTWVFDYFSLTPGSVTTPEAGDGGSITYNVEYLTSTETYTVRQNSIATYGDLIARNVTPGSIGFFTETRQQTATHLSGGAISSLALNAAGVLYASDSANGRVYALNNLQAKDFGLGQTELTAPTSTGVNRAPVADNDFATGTADGNAIIEVLDNDSDPETPNSGLVLQTIDRVVVAGLPDLADPASLFSVSNGRDVAFTPGTSLAMLGEGETATFHVYYTMADAAGVESSARLDFVVTGVNEAPVAVDDTATVAKHGVRDFAVLANDTDADRYDTPTRLSLAAIQSVTYDQNGTSVTVADPAAFFTIANNTLRFDPEFALDGLGSGESVDFVVTYEVADTAGASSTATFTLTIDGSDPTLTASGITRTVTTSKTGPVYNLNLVATDPAGSTYAEVGVVTSWGSATTSLTVTPEGLLTFDPSHADFAALAPGQTRTVTLNYTVTLADDPLTPAYERIVETRSLVFNVSGSAITPSDNVTGSLAIAARASDPGFSRNLLLGDPSGYVVNEETVTVTKTGGGATQGEVAVLANGNLLVDTEAAEIRNIPHGQIVTYTVTYTVQAPDGTPNASGYPATRTVTVALTGEAVAPEVVTPVVATVSETGGSIDLLAGASGNSPLQVTALTRIAGDDSGITRVGNNLVVDPTSYARLSAGEVIEVAYRYQVINTTGDPHPGLADRLDPHRGPQRSPRRHCLPWWVPPPRAGLPWP